MAVLTYPITPWTKTELYIDLVRTIAADFAARDLRFSNAKTPVWPIGKRSIDDHGIRSAGIPMRTAGTYTVGRQVVEFPISPVATPMAAAWLLASLLQNKSYGTGKYTIVTPTVKEAKWFSAMVSGTDEGSTEKGVWKALGIVPKNFKISIPASGADGGEVTFQSDLMGSLFDQVNSIAGSSGTLDSGTPILAADCSLTRAAVAMKFCSANINAEVALAASPNITTVAAGPDAFVLGDFSLTGDLTCIVEPDTTSNYYAILNGLAAKTTHALVFTVGSAIVITCTAIFEYPGEPKEQNGVYIQTFPWRALYQSVTDPKIEVTYGSDILAGWVTE